MKNKPIYLKSPEKKILIGLLEDRIKVIKETFDDHIIEQFMVVSVLTDLINKLNDEIVSPK